jgi:hypothetical protein
MLARVLMTSVAAAALAGAAMVGPAAAQNRHGGGGGGHSAGAASSDGAGGSDIVGAGPTRNIGGLSAENDAAFRHDMRISGSGDEGTGRILGSPSFEGRRFAGHGFAGRGYYARNWGDDWRWRRFGRRGGWWGSPAYAAYEYDHPAYASYGSGCIGRSPYASAGWRRPYASVRWGW